MTASAVWIQAERDIFTCSQLTANETWNRFPRANAAFARGRSPYAYCRRLAQNVDRGRVEAISLIMLGRGAGGEIAVALALVVAQGADALHVAQHQRLGARQSLLVDAERLEQFRQFIGRMRSLTDQLVQIGG